jgi:hypothetical protein
MPNPKREVKSDISEYQIAENTTITATVTSIGEPKEQQTRFGTRLYAPMLLEYEGKNITINLWLPKKTKIIHPKSNLYKILKRYGCTKLTELVGKQIQLYLDQNGFWRVQT